MDKNISACSCQLQDCVSANAICAAGDQISLAFQHDSELYGSHDEPV